MNAPLALGIRAVDCAGRTYTVRDRIRASVVCQYNDEVSSLDDDQPGAHVRYLATMTTFLAGLMTPESAARFQADLADDTYPVTVQDVEALVRDATSLAGGARPTEPSSPSSTGYATPLVGAPSTAPSVSPVASALTPTP